MADTSLFFNIVAKDKASKTFDKISGRAKLLGAAAGVLAIKFGKDSVAAFVDAEKAQNRLSDAFDKFPKLADTSIERLRELNSTLAKKTRFDDDATASGQAVLAQFGLTGKQLEKVTPLLQDYAAKTGQDLPTAATSMGRALLGNMRALKTIGINYKLTGDKTKDYAAITELMREKVGGFAEKEGKTAAGQAEILRNQFGELQEDVGSKLVPVLQSLGEKLLAVIGFIDRNKAVIVPLAKVVGGLALAVVAVNKATLVWKSTSAALNTVLSVTGFRKAATDVGALATNTSKASTASGKLVGKKGLGGLAGMMSGGPWGLAIAGGIAVVGLFAAKHQKAKARVSELASTLDEATGAITRESRAMVVSNLESDGVLKNARLMGVNLRDVTDAALGNVAAQKRVNTQLSAYITRTDKANQGTRHSGVVGSKARSTVDSLTRAIGGSNKALTSAREKALRGAEAMGTNTKAVGNNREAIGKLQSRIATLRGKIVKVGSSATEDARSRARIRALQAQINALRGRTVNVVVNTLRTASGGGVPVHSAGGQRNFSGGLSWVGERGPEIVDIPKGSNVYTNRESMAMTGGGGSSAGGSTVIVVQLDGKVLLQSLVKQQRDNGGSLTMLKTSPA